MNATLTLAVTCFYAPGDDQPPEDADPDLRLVALPGDDQPPDDADPDLRLVALPKQPADASTATASALRPARDTDSGAPHTNNRIHYVASSADKCSPYLPPNTPSQPPVPAVPTSSPIPDLRFTLSATMIPRRPPTPPIERAPFVAVVLLLSHDTIVTPVATLHDAPGTVARSLAHIAGDVPDVLRVTGAIMQIALCVTQRIANDRSLVPGSRAQFGQALNPKVILRMLVDSDVRVCHAYGYSYTAATQQRRGTASVFTRNAHITVIGTPRTTDGAPWPPSPGHSPHVADAVQVALQDVMALPAVLMVQLIRARPAISTNRLMPKHPSPTPLVVTARGTRTYSLSMAVLATHGEQYHPRYSILSRSADGT